MLCLLAYVESRFEVKKMSPLFPPLGNVRELPWRYVTLPHSGRVHCHQMVDVGTVKGKRVLPSRGPSPGHGWLRKPLQQSRQECWSPAMRFQRVSLQTSHNWGVSVINRGLSKSLIFFFLDFPLGLGHVSIRLDLEALFQFSHLILTFKVQMYRLAVPLSIYQMLGIPTILLPCFPAENKKLFKSNWSFVIWVFVLEWKTKKKPTAH